MSESVAFLVILGHFGPYYLGLLGDYFFLGFWKANSRRVLPFLLWKCLFFDGGTREDRGDGLSDGRLWC